jgi:hypothetical protein
MVARVKCLKTWNFQGCLIKKISLTNDEDFSYCNQIPPSFLYQNIKLEVIYNFTKLEFLLLMARFLIGTWIP